MLISTIAKCFAGFLVTGTVITVPILVTRGSSSITAVTRDNSESSRMIDQVERVDTSREQLERDKTFDECQKANLKFKVNDGNGGTKWVDDGEYSLSVYGQFLEVSYNSDQCSREIPKQ